MAGIKMIRFIPERGVAVLIHNDGTQRDIPIEEGRRLHAELKAQRKHFPQPGQIDSIDELLDALVGA